MLHINKRSFHNLQTHCFIKSPNHLIRRRIKTLRAIIINRAPTGGSEIGKVIVIN